MSVSIGTQHSMIPSSTGCTSTRYAVAALTVLLFLAGSACRSSSGDQNGGALRPNPPGQTTTQPGEPAKTEKDPISVLFAGDTHFEWGVADHQQKNGLTSPVSQVAPIFHHADYRILNLETPITDKGKPYVRKSYIFSTSPENLRVLEFLGLDLALLGNNHAMDMGAEGLGRTVHYLRRAGIASVGAGDDYDAASAPFYFERRGVRFAVLSFSGIGETDIFSSSRRPGVAGVNQRAILSRVREARRQADHVVVSLHWGMEYYAHASASQRSMARGLIDAGATAIIGHHSHVPQGVEMYRGGVIAYSIGNFLFGSINEQQTHNMLVQLEVDAKSKDFERIRIFPVSGVYRRAGNISRPLSAAESSDFWEDFYVMSNELSPVTAKKIQLSGDGSGFIEAK